MKGKRILLILTLLLSVIRVQAESANRFLQQGLNALEDNQLPEAVEAFQQALAQAQEREDLDPAQAHLALGTALARAGSYEEAQAQLSEALKTSNRDIQKRAQYNLGKIDYEMARTAEEQEDLQTANQNIKSSVSRFKDSIQLDPKDIESKKNFELALEKQIEIEEKLEQQQQEQQENSDENQDSEEDQENEQEQKSDQQNQDQNQDPSQDQQDQQDQEDQSQDPSQDQQDQDGQDQQDPQEDSSEQEENEQQPSQPEDGEEQESSEQEQSQGAENPEQMTEEEARNLLEAMKDKEEQQRSQYRIRLGRPIPVDKDW